MNSKEAIRERINMQAKAIRVQRVIILVLVVCLILSIATRGHDAEIVEAQGGNEAVETTPAAMAAAAVDDRVEATKRPIIDAEPLVEEHTPSAHNLGEFTLTAYCACEKCCGKRPDDPWYKITASGTVCEEGRTVAVDTDVIPMGSVLYINGNRYVAEDRGGAITGNRVDIYFDSHEDAIQFGVQTADVFIFE